MIKAVVFDMYETLITLFNSTLYKGRQIALDMGIPENVFREIWDPSDDERTLGQGKGSRETLPHPHPRKRSAGWSARASEEPQPGLEP